MHLIQIFIPLNDNEGRQFNANEFGGLRKELLQEFGGVTIYPRAPAVGLWHADDDEAMEDKIVIYEVMASTLNRDWWTQFRRRQEIAFQQDSILIRVAPVQIL